MKPRATVSGWTAVAISFATHALGAGAIAGWGAGAHGTAAAEVPQEIAVDIVEAPLPLAAADPHAEVAPHRHAHPHAAAPRRAWPVAARAAAVDPIVPASAAAAPVDFTGLTFAATPAAPSSPSGAGQPGAGGSGRAAGGAAGNGRARSVGLEESDWRCPWPDQAEAMDKNREDVVIRVVVSPDGHALSAHVLRDPGHGFGDAALACAKQTRFVPARDVTGGPIAAESPPIRVRFTR
jgi:protein TonB